MIELLILGIAAFFLWRYFTKKDKYLDAKANELTTAVNDTYSYLGGMVTEQGIREQLASGSVRSVIDDVKDVVKAKMILEDGAVILGDRKGNVARGIALEEDIERMESEIQTTREFKQYRKAQPELEARLDVWREVANSTFPVALNRELRDRHTYVIGKSGSGKTTLLTWMVVQDLLDEQGVAFLTPEAETIEHDILPYIPEERKGEVIYFNPADDRCRYSFNPLHRDPGDDIDRKVEEVFTSITRLMEGAGSARINQILRQVIYALVELPDTTLLDIPRLLDRENPHYRKQVIAQLEDPQTKRFWRTTYNEFPRNAHVPIMTRLARFIRPRHVRNVLCRPEKGLDFREIMDSGKVLLCNLSDGLLGERTSQLLGGLIMSELQLATIGRADVPPQRRRRFYVYLDEFHSFTSHANVSYGKLLSRARKYRLPLILAHQQTGQLSTDLVREVFGNVSTLISFLVSRRDANQISRECIRDDLPGRVTVAPEELVTLNVGEAFVKIGTHAFPMYVTTTLREFKKDWATKADIVYSSRREEKRQVTAERQQDGTSEEPPRRRAATKPSDGIPADPFADLTDPQDLY